MGAFRRDLLTTPNVMSLFRIASAPLLAVFWFGFEWRIIALALGTLSGITDLLDGWIARKFNQTTELGALLDQLGDLIFESVCILIGVVMGELWCGWLVIYLLREFSVNVMRSFVTSRGGSLPSSVLGKAKSSCIQWAFFLLFLGDILEHPPAVPPTWQMVGILPGQILITAGVVWIITGLALSVLSGWIYLRAFIRFYATSQTRGTSG